MSRANKVVGAAILLMGITIISRLVGFVRQQVIAYYYGTGPEAEAFIAALTLPTLILTITGGAISAALIPMIVRLRNENEEVRLKQLIGSMFSLTSLLMVVLTMSLYFVLEPFVQIYVPGFSEPFKDLTLHMLKIIVPTFVAIALISLITAILNAYRYYLIPALGPIFYSLGVIIGAVFFSSTYGVESLMIGMAIGILVHFVFALCFIFFKKISIKPSLVINEDIKQVGILVLPIFISVAAFQLNVLVDRMMASTAEQGSVAALGNANVLVQLPISLFVGSMVLPLFPTIADKLSKNDFSGTRELLSNTYRLIGILLFPVTGIFLVLSEPIIAVLFQRGAFDEYSVSLTSKALLFYSVMVFPFAMRDIMTRAFYSLQDTWTPVVNSVIMVTINIILMLILVPQFGMIGVAGSTSIAAIIAYFRLRYLLVKKIGAYQSEQSKKAWIRIALNSVALSIFTWMVYYALHQLWTEPTGLHLYLRTFISLGLGGILYLYLTLKLETAEVQWLRQRIRKVLRRS